MPDRQKVGEGTPVWHPSPLRVMHLLGGGAMVPYHRVGLHLLGLFGFHEPKNLFANLQMLRRNALLFDHGHGRHALTSRDDGETNHRTSGGNRKLLHWVTLPLVLVEQTPIPNSMISYFPNIVNQ